MLVGIDASRAIADRPTGTEAYSRRLIDALLARDSLHRFRLYFRQPPPSGLFRGAELRTIPFPRLWTHLRLAWEVAKHPPDALFVPAHVLPSIHPCPSLVTIHDLGYLRFPKSHPWRQRLYLDLSTRWNAYTATHLLADSQATRADLVTHYSVAANKITVAYPGTDESLGPVRDVDAIEAAKARYNISGDYFLYLGTLQPRKNLPRLVEAFAEFATRLSPSAIQLVLAGKRGWLYDDLFEQVSRRGLFERVRFPGYVAEEDKAALLSGALAFVFPSLHEGFGLPVVEAQACGCPVITSNTSSLPEVAGDGALLVDPEDTADIVNAMQRIATEPWLCEELIERGFANEGRFSWATCAETVLKAIDAHLC
ncbi:MAG: glycosyltransferase family 1 protein [Anaerolineae bacterium]|jgi:glycosyltransferase involved in cell wall biosynthesis